MIFSCQACALLQGFSSLGVEMVEEMQPFWN